MKGKKVKNKLLFAMLAVVCVSASSYAGTYEMKCYTPGAPKNSLGEPVCQGDDKISVDGPSSEKSKPLIEISPGQEEAIHVQCINDNNDTLIPTAIHATCQTGGVNTNAGMVSCQGSMPSMYMRWKVGNSKSQSAQGYIEVDSITCPKPGNEGHKEIDFTFIGCKDNAGFVAHC
jgi:hypothetical protein